MSDPRVRARAQARAAAVESDPERVVRYYDDPTYRAAVDAAVAAFLEQVDRLDRRHVASGR